MTCNCDGCKKLNALEKYCNLLPEEFREDFQAFIDEYINISDENDYFKSVISGTWPGADEVIEHARSKVKKD